MKFILFLLFCCQSACIAQSPTQELLNFKGNWYVHHVKTGFSPGLSPEEIRSVIGRKLVFSDSVFEFLDWRQLYPKYYLDTVSVKNLFPIFKTDASEIGIEKDSIQVVRIKYGKNEMDLIMLMYTNFVVLPKRGCFFFFEKKE